MVDLKDLIEKNLIHPKLRQLKICVSKNWKLSPEEFFPVFIEPIKRCPFFAGGKVVMSEELKKQVVQHFRHTGLKKTPATTNIFLRSWMRKYLDNKCSTCTACVSSRKNLKYELPSTEKITLPELIEPTREKQIDFFDKAHHKHVTGEP